MNGLIKQAVAEKLMHAGLGGLTGLAGGGLAYTALPFLNPERDERLSDKQKLLGLLAASGSMAALGPWTFSRHGSSLRGLPAGIGAGLTARLAEKLSAEG